METLNLGQIAKELLEAIAKTDEKLAELKEEAIKIKHKK